MTEQEQEMEADENHAKQNGAVMDDRPLSHPDFPEHGPDGLEFMSDEDDEIEEYLPPDHPLYARAQEVLKDQLDRAEKRVKTQLIEKENEAARVKKTREDVGVELYGLQQQLAKLNMALERLYERFNGSHASRTEIEAALDDLTSQFEDQAGEGKAMEQKFHQHQKDLDKLTLQVKHVEVYNLNMEEDINAVRREAYAAEESMVDIEKGKSKQDILIDHLNKQLHGMDAELELYKTQTKIQAKETHAARDTLLDASREMSKVRNETREYLQKWKSTLVETEQRDRALKASEKVLLEEKETIVGIQHEIDGFRKEVQEVDEVCDRQRKTHQSVTEQNEKVKSDENDLLQKQADCEEQISSFRKSIEETDTHLDSLKMKKSKLQDQVNKIQAQIEKMLRQKQIVIEEIDEQHSEEITLKHSAANVQKGRRKILQEVHAKELEIGKLHNDIARVTVDVINTEAVLRDLTQNLAECNEELDEKNKIIEQYESEKRRRRDLIGQKQIRVDRLNKKYDTLSKHAAAADEEAAASASPLENTIKAIMKELAKLSEESGTLQMRWLANQTDLVKVVNNTANTREVIDELQTRQTILTQKQLRIDAEAEHKKKKTATINKTITGLQHDMTKLNRLIAVHKELLERVSTDLYGMKMEFSGSLKDDEEEATKLEEKMAKIVQDRIVALEKIKELEKQILLWERKIQLEIETQQALDPSYGRKEIEEMRKEVHRMEIRKGQIKRKQEAMIKEMELSISKREAIQLRNFGKSKKAVTQAAVKKKNASLRTALKANIREHREIQSKVTEQYHITQDLANKLKAVRTEHEHVVTDRRDLRKQVNDLYLQKDLTAELSSILEKQGTLFKGVVQGRTAEVSSLDVGTVTKEHAALVEELNATLKAQPNHEKWVRKIMAAIA